MYLADLMERIPFRKLYVAHGKEFQPLVSHFVTGSLTWVRLIQSKILSLMFVRFADNEWR